MYNYIYVTGENLIVTLHTSSRSYIKPNTYVPKNFIGLRLIMNKHIINSKVK